MFAGLGYVWCTKIPYNDVDCSRNLLEEMSGTIEGVSFKTRMRVGSGTSSDTTPT